MTVGGAITSNRSALNFKTMIKTLIEEFGDWIKTIIKRIICLRRGHIWEVTEIDKDTMSDVHCWCSFCGKFKIKY